MIHCRPVLASLQPARLSHNTFFLFLGKSCLYFISISLLITLKKTIILSYALAVFGALLCPAVADTAQEMVDKAMTAIKSNDTDTAVELIKAADNQGYHAESRYLLGVYYHHLNHADKAVEQWAVAADQGVAPAQNCLGVCCFCGEGMPQDKQEAAKWFRKAAEQGFAGAQYNLGVCYFYGEGMPQDKQAAAKWLRKAADQGFVGAQYNNLSVCYDNGEGVPQDKQAAAK